MIVNSGFSPFFQMSKNTSFSDHAANLAQRDAPCKPKNEELVKKHRFVYFFLAFLEKGGKIAP
jgi:hypothetical protein